MILFSINQLSMTKISLRIAGIGAIVLVVAGLVGATPSATR